MVKKMIELNPDFLNLSSKRSNKSRKSKKSIPIIKPNKFANV